MSARRDRRPPSGRVVNGPTATSGTGNAGSSSARLDATDRPPRPHTAFPLRSNTPNNRPTTTTTPTATMATASPPLTGRRKTMQPASNRSDTSELSMNEVLRRIREKSDIERRQQQDREIDLMGPYNAFSRPKTSSTIPLRSVLLDPEVNNFPRSRTRTELMKRLKASYMPHPSYDLDNDGYVSCEDYRLAKRFDMDGNGVLDRDERAVGQRVLAEEFFARHKDDLHLFGRNIAQRNHKENVDKLVNSYSFERAYGKLCSVERTLKAESSAPMTACMSDLLTPLDKSTTYYSDKLDTTAWTDLDRLPRSVKMMQQSTTISTSFPPPQSSSPTTTSPPSSYTILPPAVQKGTWVSNDHSNSQASLFSSMHPSNASLHSGSRKRLLFARKEAIRTQAQDHLIQSQRLNDQWARKSFGRVQMISNIRVENG